MSNTISASVSGGTINASVSGSSGVASVGGSGSPVSISIGGGGISGSGGPAIAPVQSVNGQVGNVSIPVTKWVPYKPPGVVWLVSSLDSGTFSLSARSTTGYIAVLWWDGATQAFGSGTASQYVPASKAVLASGNWARSSPKQVFVWSCVSAANATQSGALTGFSCTSKKVFALSVDGCSSLLEVSCDTNQITSLNLTGCAALQTVSCHINSLAELDVSEATSLTSLYCQSNLLKGLNVSNNTSLQLLSCSNNLLTTLDLSQNTSLSSLYCSSNQLTSLNLNASLINVNASSNLLTSVRAIGVAASGFAGLNVSTNSLSASALNTLYSDLAAVQSGSIYVSGNPGTSGDIPTIATAKGYAVYG